MGKKEVQMKDSGRQKDRQRWERKEWASLVEKHSRREKASPRGRPVNRYCYLKAIFTCNQYIIYELCLLVSYRT